MTRTTWIVLGVAYIIGLLSTNLVAHGASGLNFPGLAVLSLIFAGLGLLMAIGLCPGFAIANQKFNQNSNKITISVSIAAVIVALLAVVYFQLRIPQPKYNDISYQIAQSERPLVKVTGKVLNEPRLNDRQRLKFSLQAVKVDDEEVSGKLYATLPLLQGTGIYPGQQLNLTGFLYLPPPARSNQGFNFQQYLAHQGIFAGIQGVEAKVEEQEPGWGWWQLRQRIVRSQLQGLGSPVGQLVSSMILGGKAVDLPGGLRDRFIVAGLAHVLATSGFQVSLLLGIILKLTERVTAKPRLVIGSGTLMVYLGLTGIQASILRACLMGIAVLLALTLETKVKPLGSLFCAAVIILLLDPLLINDLGFRLSFLATLGLIVTLPKLQEKLDWLPITIASIVAVPLAASIWVFPLLCYEFNTLATYSIAVNILCTPLITIISLGGMISGIFALIVPTLGSAIASWLFYPTSLLIAITEFCTNLPGSTWAVGQIPLEILFIIYGLFALIWCNQWWQRRWWLGFLFPLVFIIMLGFYNSTQVQVAILATQQSPSIVMQDRGKVILINSGKNNQAKYTLLPFLAQQGINTIDYGLAYDDNSNSATEWQAISQRVRIKSMFGTKSPNLSRFKTSIIETFPTIITKSARLSRDADLNLINLQIADNSWLILSKPQTPDKIKQKIVNYIQQQNLTAQQPILVCSGDLASLRLDLWLELLQPQMAIASKEQLSWKIEKILQQKQIEFQDIAATEMIRWNPQQGLMQTQDLLN